MKLTRQTHNAQRGALAVVALASTLALLAGCGGSSPSSGVAHLGSSTAATSASADPSGSGGPENSATIQKAMVGYARCMRTHGVPSFPEPDEGHIIVKNHVGPNGNSSSGPAGVNPESPAFQTADKSCRKLLPNGGKPNPQQQKQAVESALAFSRCMRSHGVPNFPSPQVFGNGIRLKVGGAGLNPGSPQFQAAQKACQSSFGPKGGKGFGAVPAPPPGGGPKGGGSQSGATLAVP